VGEKENEGVERLITEGGRNIVEKAWINEALRICRKGVSLSYNSIREEKNKKKKKQPS